MTAAPIRTSTRATTAYPPLPRQPYMDEWLARKKLPFWKRVWGGKRHG
jgi:hypothetical protein